MSTKKKGMLTVAKEWCKHLRSNRLKYNIWSKERQASKKLINNELNTL